MSAPTTPFVNGSGVITTTGEANGLLLTLPNRTPYTRLLLGVGGTFTSCVIAVRGRINVAASGGSSGEFVPLQGITNQTSALITNSQSISLTNSTNAGYTFDVTPYDEIEVWGVSGTFTSFTAQVNPFPAAGPMFTVATQVITGSQSISGATVITSNSADAFDVGPNGSTNPTFQIDASTSSATGGLKVTGAGSGSGVALVAQGSAAAEPLSIDAKGTGIITVGATSTGNVVLGTSGHTLTLNNSTGAVTLAAGGLTMTSGNLLLSSGKLTVTSNDAAAFTVGPNGATNPGLKVVASTSSATGGITITGAASASGVAIAAIGSATNEPLKLDAKGSGTVTIGGTSTGNVLLTGGGGIVVVTGTLTAGGLATCGIQVATSGPAIYSGSGVPTLNAALKGSFYMRSDGSSSATRLYVSADTSGSWIAVTTAS